MDGIEAFVQHREVYPYRNVFAYTFILLVAFSILGLALSKTISTIVCVLVTLVILLFHVVVFRRKKKNELFLNEALGGAECLMIVCVLTNSFAHYINVQIQFYLIIAVFCVAMVLMTFLQVRNRIKKRQYRREAPDMRFDDLRIAVGMLAGGLGYIVADLFSEQIHDNVQVNICIALLIALTFLLLIKATESVMLHYYVKKYNLSSLIRVKHIQ